MTLHEHLNEKISFFSTECPYYFVQMLPSCSNNEARLTFDCFIFEDHPIFWLLTVAILGEKKKNIAWNMQIFNSCFTQMREFWSMGLLFFHSVGSEEWSSWVVIGSSDSSVGQCGLDYFLFFFSRFDDGCTVCLAPFCIRNTYVVAVHIAVRWSSST